MIFEAFRTQKKHIHRVVISERLASFVAWVFWGIGLILFCCSSGSKSARSSGTSSSSSSSSPCTRTRSRKNLEKLDFLLIFIGWFKLIPSILPLHSSNNCSDSSHTLAFWSPAFDSPSKLLVASIESWDHIQLERAWRLVLGSNAKDIRQATNSWHLAGCSRHEDYLNQTNANSFKQ